ncbi:hypothetical protein [Arthrobacter pascens]|uniref:hypothetical protein n=1 Tax=Arthrobacter pascens TaxID=1677 RepID=UPI001F0988C2|nr:hypothetical protein [Arthrobacter pascens]
MTFPQAVLSFAVVAGLLTLVPGIDTSIVLRAGLTRRRAAAFATAAGVCCGALAWGAAAAVGPRIRARPTTARYGAPG